MDTIERLIKLLPSEISLRMRASSERLIEVRIRVGRAIELRYYDGHEFIGSPVSATQLSQWLSALMDFSLYSREREIAQGFFTLRDGCRVGVCGRAVFEGKKIAAYSAIGSICIRIARTAQGCADTILPLMLSETGIQSVLIASPPGMGKTTLLRDIARQVSDQGHCVGIADERHELAVCHAGVPTLDVGNRTDVIDGCPKHVAIHQLVRGMAPELLVTDEVGDERDAEALSEARRCGVAIAASAHAENFEALCQRRSMYEMLSDGIFNLVVQLGGSPGCIREIRQMARIQEGMPIWKLA